MDLPPLTSRIKGQKKGLRDCLVETDNETIFRDRAGGFVSMGSFYGLRSFGLIFPEIFRHSSDRYGITIPQKTLPALPINPRINPKGLTPIRNHSLHAGGVPAGRVGHGEPGWKFAETFAPMFRRFILANGISQEAGTFYP
ncbi:hypothetical protein HZ994_00750 [Akkermansiaceae bacterium]|nr:hypothetical protein HZ994_00750 [Akkermansiaceae bacterium]